MLLVQYNVKLLVLNEWSLVLADKPGGDLRKVFMAFDLPLLLQVFMCLEGKGSSEPDQVLQLTS